MSIDLNDPRARQMFLANMSEQPTTSQMQQPQAQGPDSLAEFTRLLGGDLSGSLTGGDKLLALSALMRSATRSGRRAGLTPQQVMGQLQQQKVAELQNRMALQGMQQKARQEEAARAATEKYRARLRELTQTGEAMSPALLNRLGQEAIANGDVEMGLKFFEQATKLTTEDKLPLTRERIEGNTLIQEQYDPVTGTFKEIGRGSRFAPRGGGVTVNVGDTGRAKVFSGVGPNGEQGFYVEEPL